MAAPPVPNIASGNQVFSADMRAFHAWEAGELSDSLNAYESARLLSTTTTSASSVLIGTGDKTFTVGAGLGFVAGQSVNAVSTANPANSMSGFVKSYSSTTLVVTVITITGSGTLAAWSIALGLSGGGASLGTNTFTGAQNFAQGADIASAATINLTTATGNILTVTGTVATSAVTLSSGMTRIVRAAAAWPLTYNATTNNITGGVSTTLAAGDFVFYQNISGVVYGLIIKANGRPLALPDATTTSSGGVELATTAEMQTGTDTTRAVTVESVRLGAIVQTAIVTLSSTTTTITTSIPTWAKVIFIQVSGMSTSGTSIPILRLGVGGTAESTNYLGGASTGTAVTNGSTGAALGGTQTAAYVRHGGITLTKMEGSNTWVLQGVLNHSEAAQFSTTGYSKALAGVLDSIFFTTVNGTDTFDGGTVSVSYL